MIETNNPSPTWHRLAEAITFAFDIHASQTRKGAETPYIGHLLGVTSLVIEHGGDEDQAIGGMLHDAIEDCGIAQEAVILAKWGARVAAIVRGCTDADTFPKPPWLARKEAYLAHLESAGPDILLVSCADKLHNARAILTDLKTHGAAVFNRFTAGEPGTLWYYRELSEVLVRRLPCAMSRDLMTTIRQIADWLLTAPPSPISDNKNGAEQQPI